jgi:hypothetical protein
MHKIGSFIAVRILSLWLLNQADSKTGVVAAG